MKSTTKWYDTLSCKLTEMAMQYEAWGQDGKGRPPNTCVYRQLRSNKCRKQNNQNLV